MRPPYQTQRTNAIALLFAVPIILCITTSACDQRAPDKSADPAPPAAETFRYVDTLSGLNVRTAPNRDGRIQDVVRFGDRLFVERVGPVETIGGRTARWLEVRYRPDAARSDPPEPMRRGHVFGAYVSEGTPEFFYRAEVRAGLRAYEKPARSSKVVTVIPEGRIGRIMSAAHAEVIDDRRGLWLLAQYESRQGWIFSGDTRLARMQEDLGTETKYGPDIAYIPDITEPGLRFADVRDRVRIVRSYSVGVYDAYQILVNADAKVRCEGPLHQVYFVQRQNGRTFSETTPDEIIVATDFLFLGAVLSRSIECWCCCGGAYLRVSVPEAGTVVRFAYAPARKTGLCAWSAMGAQAEQAVENRLLRDDDTVHFFSYRRTPLCELPAGKSNEGAEREAYRYETSESFRKAVVFWYNHTPHGLRKQELPAEEFFQKHAALWQAAQPVKEPHSPEL